MLSHILGALLWAIPLDGAPICDPPHLNRTAGDKADAVASLQIEKAAKGIIDVAYVYVVSGPCAPLVDGLIHSQVRDCGDSP